MGYVSRKLSIIWTADPVISFCSVQYANSRSQNGIYRQCYDCAGKVSVSAYRLGNIAERDFSVVSRVKQIIQIIRVFDINSRMVKVTGAAQ